MVLLCYHCRIVITCGDVCKYYLFLSMCRAENRMCYLRAGGLRTFCLIESGSLFLYKKLFFKRVFNVTSSSSLNCYTRKLFQTAELASRKSCCHLCSFHFPVRQHLRNPTSQREHDDTPNIDSAYINADATHYTESQQATVHLNHFHQFAPADKECNKATRLVPCCSVW
jgi:hypothetical protein